MANQIRGDFLSGGGEMGKLMRSFDWAKTPLGSVESFPQSLRSAISILLPSKAQIALFWGSEFIKFYNDAYSSVLGAKHPTMFGKPQMPSSSHKKVDRLLSRYVT
ncbi:putative sensor protein [Calothrix sp. NIES-4071]|nr:putative sensor protein [Calothrix sp. NIES-4071]BAZ62498.1 putative sensor protein [Calothrix sp. NIES-4105]